MKYRKMGRTGLKVSRICLGTMTFGKADWGCDEAASVAMINTFIEEGGNFIDTADMYADGKSEEITGKALAGKRHEVVLATKFTMPMGNLPTQRGASKRYIMEACEASLKRLQTDYIDLYQMHCWDDATPIDESLEALNDLVRRGLVRYIGCSNFQAWQIMKANWISDSHHWSRFDCLQPQYSLLVRDIEREILPVCMDQEIGIIPWSPLANGMLTGKYRQGHAPDSSTRFGINEWGVQEQYFSSRNFRIVNHVVKSAKRLGRSPAQIALAWLLADMRITSVIIGARTMEQLTDNVVPGDWDLPEQEWKKLHRISHIDYGYPNTFIAEINQWLNSDYEQ